MRRETVGIGDDDEQEVRTLMEPTRCKIKTACTYMSTLSRDKVPNTTASTHSSKLMDDCGIKNTTH